jgi:hypothetical protein
MHAAVRAMNAPSKRTTFEQATAVSPLDRLRKEYLMRRSAHEHAYEANRIAREEARAARQALEVALKQDAADQIGRESKNFIITDVAMGVDLKLYPLVRRRHFKAARPFARFDWEFDHDSREWRKREQSS